MDVYGSPDHELKNRWGQPRTGSSPVSGTTVECVVSHVGEALCLAFIPSGWNSGCNRASFRILGAPLEETIQSIHVLAMALVEVSVAICGDTDRAMAHPSRERTDIHAGGDAQRGVGMA